MANFYPNIALFSKDSYGTNVSIKTERLLLFSHIPYRSKGMEYISGPVETDVSEFDRDAERVKETGVLTVSMYVKDGVYGIAKTLQDAQGKSATRFDITLFLQKPGETYNESIEERGSHKIVDAYVDYARLFPGSNTRLYQIVTFKQGQKHE
jgi:hypothetical protein